MIFDNKEFATGVLNKNDKIFVVYIAAFSTSSNIHIF